MSVDKQTIQTYDDSAAAFSEHFQTYKDGIASKEVLKAFELAGNPKQARVVEVGCGAGKDAVAIVQLAGWYQGFDPAQKLLELARTQVPGVSFVQADALTYQYPKQLDIVFGFASMLHLNRDDFKQACRYIAAALRPGGILCLTLKEAKTYTEQAQTDDFGTRRFFLYTPADVQQLAGATFELVYEEHLTAGPRQKPWMTLILKRVQ